MPTRYATGLLALTLGAGAPGAAMAQDYLSRAEIEAHLRESVFCYYPNERFACAWAEIYTEFNADHTVLFSAAATWQEPMEVLEFRIDWRGDALCIPYDDQGLRQALQADGYRFPFDLEGLEPQAEGRMAELVTALQADAPREFCFQYSDDPDIPGQLLQHVFRDGVEDAERDPIALIPMIAGGVAINPS